MISLDTAEKALKDLYLGVVSEQLNIGTNPFLAKIQQTSSDVFGKEIVRLASYGINGGVSAGKETDELPAASGNNYAQFRLGLKNLFGTIEISDKAVRASENTAGAFVNLLNAEMEGLLKASKFNFGRMIFGDGTGVLANVTSTDTDKKKINVSDTKNLIEGMVIDIIDAQGYTVGSKLKIVKVSRSGNYIYVESNNLNFGSTCRIAVQKSFGQELTGLGAIFGSSASLYGLSRTDNEWLNPSLKDAGGSSVSSTLIQNAIDDTEALYGASPDIVISSYGVRRAMIDYLSINRVNLDYMNLDGGYKALSFNGIPWVAERFVEQGSAYILNSADFKLHQLCDWRWLETESGRVIRQIPGKAAYSATLVKYADLICDRPCGQIKIQNISEI
ncbi:MAG: phage major capsid protein [Clostridiales bacterium]|jgi:hypothetical protein|nr:phage major capsid protein [Clostridiales bacterium]